MMKQEYINEENIAVTVLEASFSEYNPDTGKLLESAKNASYSVYFLNTETMKLSKTPHVTEISLGTALEGQLCPAMRRFPNLGSLVAELAVAGVELFRKILDLSLGLPGMIHIWQSNRVGCSLITRFVHFPFPFYCLL